VLLHVVINLVVYEQLNIHINLIKEDQLSQRFHMILHISFYWRAVYRTHFHFERNISFANLCCSQSNSKSKFPAFCRQRFNLLL